MTVILIQYVTLIDGTGADPQPRRSIVIEGAHIVWIGPHDAVDRSRPFESEIDGTGKYVMPGLIDAHVHVCWNGRESISTLVKENDRDRLAPEAGGTLRAILHCGPNTLRDIGGHD